MAEAPPAAVMPPTGTYAPNFTAPPNFSFPGMEPLLEVESLFVKQKIDLLESVAKAAGGFGCCEQANTYYVFDGAPEAEPYRKENDLAHFFTIKEIAKKEIADICCRACCNPFHPMDLEVHSKKMGDAKTFSIQRPFKGCGFACCPCCLQEWNVLAADGRFIGQVTQPLFGGCFCPHFDLKQAGSPEQAKEAEPYWFIKGPHCIGELCCTVKFDLLDSAKAKAGDEEAAKIGHIDKVSPGGGGGALQELATDADNFEFRVPKEASAEQKAIALTGMILLDYYFFEDGGAFECNPFAAPGEPCCKLNLCSQYCCGSKCTYAFTCNRPEPGE